MPDDFDLGDFGMGDYSTDYVDYSLPNYTPVEYVAPEFDLSGDMYAYNPYASLDIEGGVTPDLYAGSDYTQIGEGLYVDDFGNVTTQPSIAQQLSGDYTGPSYASYGPGFNATPVGGGIYVGDDGQLHTKDPAGAGQRDTDPYFQSMGVLPYGDGTYITKTGEIVGVNSSGVPQVPQVSRAGNSLNLGNLPGALRRATGAQKAIRGIGDILAIIAALRGEKQGAPAPTQAQLVATPTNWNAPRAMARGGAVGALGLLRNKNSGQADVIPVAAAGGEYVFDADTVSALGDGNTEAGAARLDEMRQQIRQHKRAAPATKIPPKAKSPLAYLKGAK